MTQIPQREQRIDNSNGCMGTIKGITQDGVPKKGHWKGQCVLSGSVQLTLCDPGLAPLCNLVASLEAQGGHPYMLRGRTQTVGGKHLKSSPEEMRLRAHAGDLGGGPSPPRPLATTTAVPLQSYVFDLPGVLRDNQGWV